MRELKDRVETIATMIQDSRQTKQDDLDIELPANIQLPMSSMEHIEAMETALDSTDFRRRLVCVQILICFLFYHLSHKWTRFCVIDIIILVFVLKQDDEQYRSKGRNRIRWKTAQPKLFSFKWC